ncbi:MULTISPECIES: fibronectin type III domain-containing protein [unclassified Helicobacter]|uniref:fibronectin type III domain-containing protein n=1 Tax=unclassified Helicobacter TaxID=2593540 RepID=UPI0013159F57|nr:MULTISPECIES: fibronectin type III domain-containing protein [unclassified Helicobacter]
MDNSLPTISYARTITDVTSVGFEWKSPSGLENVEGYAITYKDDKQQNIPLAIVKNPYATHHFVAGLKPQTNYTFYIVVLGKENNISPQSKAIEIKTSFINPIENVFASKDLPQQVKVFWSPHPNPSIKKYIIQRQNNEGKFLNIGIVPHRLFVEFFDKNLEDGKSYVYRVIAESFEGVKSIASTVAVGFTRKKPNGLNNIQASNNLSKSILITWEIPSDTKYPITSFKIYAANNMDEKFKLVGESTKNFFKEEKLKDNQVRYYKVVPVDRDGIEGDLGVGAVKGITLPPPPTPKITSARVKNQRAIIRWEKIEGDQEISYKVCRTEKGSKKTRICFENIQIGGFIDKEMKAGILYYYEVFSVDSNKTESAPTEVIKLGF